MIDLLTKYKNWGHFFFKPDDNLSQVCNAPEDKSGVYVIYALEHNHVNLIYIGRSGKKGSDETLVNREDGLHGRITRGKQFGDRRAVTWPLRMKQEGIEALDIYWFVTYDQKHKDFPDEVEDELLDIHLEIYERLPRWNRKGNNLKQLVSLN